MWSCWRSSLDISKIVRKSALSDLGAGLGSNLRGTYSALPMRQHWLLVDHDPQLLSAAIETIAGWADSARPTTSGLEATKNGRSLHVELRRLDLAANPDGWSDSTPDLVTAAALFDLVSEEWIEKFVAALVRSKVVFYTVLTHDAETEWTPPHAADGAMKAAFESHFGRDKGFGPSSWRTGHRSPCRSAREQGIRGATGAEPLAARVR